MFGSENSQMFTLFISYTNENEKVHYLFVCCGIHWLDRYNTDALFGLYFALVFCSNLYGWPRWIA